MATKIGITWPDSGVTIYARIRGLGETVWNGTAFVAFVAANVADYDLACTEITGSGEYQLDIAALPAAAKVAGLYRYQFFRQLDAAPAIADPLVAELDVCWDGAALSPGWTAAQIAALVGTGDVEVDHDYGGTDALRFTQDGAGLDGATIRAYLKSEYDAGTRKVRGRATTGTDGRWEAPMMLDDGTYYLIVSKPGAIEEEKVTVTVT